jgi:hypothetical protein
MLKVTSQEELDKAFLTDTLEIEIASAISFEIKIPAGKAVKLITTVNCLLRFFGMSCSTVEAWGSSQPTVEAWGSSQPRVVARGYVQLSLFGKFTATLSEKCHAVLHGGAKAKGGSSVKVEIKTAKDWCEYYGVEVKANIAILYKGVKENYASNHDADFFYLPATKPKSTNWKGGKTECGPDGLHFSPCPSMTKEFINDPKHFIACPVALKDMAIHPEGTYPQKCQASHVCKPCWEVDIDGNKIEQSALLPRRTP